MNLFKNKKQQSTKDISEIYQLLNIKPLNHLDYISNKIANSNANLFNGTITYNNDAITKFLQEQLFQERNWVSEYNQSTTGLSAYILLNDNSELQIVTGIVDELFYDINHKLTQINLKSKDYQKNEKTVRMTTCFYPDASEGKSGLKRIINEVIDGKGIDPPLEFDDYKPDPNLQQIVIFKTSVFPMVIMSNLPNKSSDTSLLVDKINILDAIWEQILLDCILNSPKFIFGNLFSNNQTMINRSVKQLITKNYLFNNNNPNDNPKELVSIIQGNFKGKHLTNVYDWYYNSILQDSGIYQEVNCYDTIKDNTNNPIILQKIKQRKVDLMNLVTILVKLDNDLFKGETFNVKDISTITLDYQLVTNIKGGK